MGYTTLFAAFVYGDFYTKLKTLKVLDQQQFQCLPV